MLHIIDPRAQQQRLITVIAGGTGSVKLVRGLARIVGSDMAVIANVGDNIWLHGLYVCPDVDTVVYGLAGMLDEKRGWGVQGDTFSFLGQLRQAGEKPWFSLGDKDLAMHVVRTAMMKEGRTLSEVTRLFAEKYSIDTKVIPATDSEVATMISTPTGEMHLQEFWVKNKGRPKVTAVRYAGVEKAKRSVAAIDAIRNSDMIIIAPGNPVSSIGPTAAIAGLRAELVRTRERVIAVSPIIGDRPVSGPAAKYMKAVGLKSSPAGVAAYYRDFAGALVISKSDAGMSGRIRRLGMDCHETNITMADRQDEVRLARYLLKVGTR